MTVELKKRTIAKTMTWRVTASLTTFLIAWIINGRSFDRSLYLEVSQAIAKVFLYYFHERIWNRYKSGQKINKCFNLKIEGFFNIIIFCYYHQML